MRKITTIIFAVGTMLSVVGLASFKYLRGNDLVHIIADEVPIYQKPILHGEATIIAVAHKGDSFQVGGKTYGKDYLFYTVNVGGRVGFILHDSRKIEIRSPE